MLGKKRKSQSTPKSEGCKQLALDFGCANCSAMQWMAQQINDTVKKVQKFHKRKPRGICANATTARLWKLFREHKGRWLMHCQIRQLLGCSKSALDWALRWLRKTGNVECGEFKRPSSKPVFTYRLID